MSLEIEAKLGNRDVAYGILCIEHLEFHDHAAFLARRFTPCTPHLLLKWFITSMPAPTACATFTAMKGVECPRFTAVLYSESARVASWTMMSLSWAILIEALVGAWRSPKNVTCKGKGKGNEKR